MLNFADGKKYCKHQGTRVLLVEGNDDCHVILALCKEYDLPESFGIYECGGYDKLLRRLNALILQYGVEIIGVVIDADFPDMIQRWQKIQQKIKDYGYEFPETPDPKGSILRTRAGKPRLGLWLMPDNHAPGMLEDFLIRLADPETVSAARECVETAKRKGLTSFKNVHHSKALIHTYLAWQDEPGKPLGQSVTAHALQADMELARDFVNWLNLLFNAP
jgi:hypothetical protein